MILTYDRKYKLSFAWSLQIVRNANRAVLYSQCIPTSICLILIGGFFVWRGVQAIVYLIMGKVNMIIILLSPRM